MAWQEERLHAWLARRLGGPGSDRLAGAVGHDAALLSRPPGRLAICVDQCVEGVHFEVDTPPRRVGEKAAARALSDLAATAARPVALLAALRAAPSVTERRMREILAAVERAARAVGARLVGGDISQGVGPMSLAVTAVGVLAPKGRPPGRDRARVGQVVLLTGPVGGSGLGRHLAIQPRLDEGRWLHASGATAMMDVSDGLALDLQRMARASGVRIDLETIPVHRDARRAARLSGRGILEHATCDGEDHELIVTMAHAAAARALRNRARRCPGLVRIGQVRRGRGLWIVDSAGQAHAWDGRGGWRHGS
jgi:thiamine-monophosphate kinase